MIFTTSRTSFLIVVAIGFICYLYRSFCIYVHQIFTCFELLQSQNKERRNENSTDMSTSLSTIFTNYNSSFQFNITNSATHRWNDIKIWLIQIGFSVFYDGFCLVLYFVLCIIDCCTFGWSQWYAIVMMNICA